MLCHVALKRPENFRKRPLLQSSCERNRKQTAFTTLETDRSLPFSLYFSLTILSRTASYRNFVYHALEYGTTFAHVVSCGKYFSTETVRRISGNICEYMMLNDMLYCKLLMQLWQNKILKRKKLFTHVEIKYRIVAFVKHDVDY